MECFKTFFDKIYGTFGQQRLIFYPVNKKIRYIFYFQLMLMMMMPRVEFWTAVWP